MLCDADGDGDVDVISLNHDTDNVAVLRNRRFE